MSGRNVMTTHCPVCWQTVRVSERGRIGYHRDTNPHGRSCPMGGNYLPADVLREIRSGFGDYRALSGTR
ncbi:MAG: hypothetical protein GX542_01660 [Rhodococcus sp.]|nr:hypothetical protein [Rhodococcus sp. (in: high G+C Gram-positive bacteria)]